MTFLEQASYVACASLLLLDIVKQGISANFRDTFSKLQDCLFLDEDTIYHSVWFYHMPQIEKLLIRSLTLTTIALSFIQHIIVSLLRQFLPFYVIDGSQKLQC